MKQRAAIRWPEEKGLFHQWGAAYVALLPVFLLCGMLFTILFSTLFVVFVEIRWDLTTFDFANLMIAILIILFYGVIAAVAVATIGLVTTLIVAVCDWSLVSKLQPDAFAALAISLAMVPVGYMAILVVAFSVYPSEFWLAATFVGTICFGSAFAVIDSRKFGSNENESVLSGRFRFNLRLFFVVTGIVAFGLTIDRGSYVFPYVLTIYVAVNAVVLVISRCCRKCRRVIR